MLRCTRRAASRRCGWVPVSFRWLRPLVVLGGVVALGDLSVCRVQAQPSVTGSAPSATLVQEAAPDARFHRGSDGSLVLAHGLGLTAPGRSVAERALHVLTRFARDFGAEGMDVRAGRVLRVHGRTVVRLERHAFGLPVHGRVAVVGLDRSGQVDLVRADLGARAEDGSGPLVWPADLEARALARLPHWPARHVVHARPVAADTGAVVVRAWALEVEGRGPSKRALLLFDARDGAFLGGEHLAYDALGRVYESNPVLSMGETTDRELPNLTSDVRLSGTYVRTASCDPHGGPANCQLLHHAQSDAEGNYLFDPEEPAFDDAFAEVNAYFHVDRISAYFREQHGFEWRCCGGDTAMDVLVNYTETPGEPHNNASYAPSSCARDFCGMILLGQSATRDYAYDSDVIYHEFTHSVIDEVVDLVGFHLDPHFGMGYDSGAVSEGTADYFAASLSGDPNMGEYFARSMTGAEASLRHLDNVLRCPDHLFGEIHRDGRIWGGLAWSIREALGADRADALLFGTLAVLDSSTTLTEAADLLVATAMAMADDGILAAGEVTAVEQAVEARGLDECEPIVPLEDGEPLVGFSGQPLQTGGLGGSVAPLHYRIAIPADATAAVLRVERLTPVGQYTVHIRAGQPVRFRGGRLPPLESDAAFEDPLPVRLDADSQPPLPRCDELFVALEVEDLTRRGPSVYSIGATLERTGDPDVPCPEPEGARDAGTTVADAGVDAAPGPPDSGRGRRDAGPGADASARRGPPDFTPGGGGGCGCQLGASPRPLPAGPALAALLLFALRGQANSCRRLWRRKPGRRKPGTG